MNKRQELVDACRSAQLAVEDAMQEDGQWTVDGKGIVSDIISRHLVDPTSTLSAATLTSVCHSLFQADRLSEPLIIELLREVQTHNSLDYLQQVVVDVVEDLQELEKSRKEETDKVTKDSSLEATQPEASRAVTILRALLDSGIVSASDVAHLVDSSRLSTFGIITSQPRHNSLEKRKRTNRFYRQKKYTLIRECSEGWARLIVLLADECAIGPGANGINTFGEPETQRSLRARTLWRKVVALIGYYDLSPARVLDLILDAFCDKLESHWRFFLELLEHTPWNVRNMGAKGKAKEMVEENGNDRSDTEFADAMDLEGGNLILTQVLGFKFGTYQEPERDLKGAIKDLEATPKELTLVTAILIKHRLVRTLDILPYLTPNDEAMEDFVADFAARVRREMGGSGNALTQSGALKDDDLPSTSTNANGRGAGATNMTSEEIDNLPRQRVMLCESLLAVGHLPPAMFMLSKWPVMAQSSALVSDLLLRVVQYSLEPAYQSIARSEGDAKRGPNYRMHFPFAVPEPTLTTIAPEPAPTEKKRFVFFYDDWQENIQRWHRTDEVVAKVTPFAKFVGPQGARNISVLVWLCRIGVVHQQNSDSEQTKKAWLDIMRVLILPSMPLLKSNYSFNIEIWPLLQRMETSQRHALYGEWHAAISNPMHSRYMPVMAAAAAQTTTEVKRILKRMTTSYDRVHARAIGKFSYSAPTALWSVILPQITSYQNMKTTVVESARYLSDFGWDVTIFMLLDALTNESKTAVKQDGTSASTWLIGVAAFIGQLAKRYSAMNLNPFFHLILNQLARDNLSGLITLKHIVSAMAGIDPIINVSPDQVKCFSGGGVLYVEGVEATRADYTEPPRAPLERTAMAGAKPQRKQNNTKARNRLLVSLESSGLAVPLLIAMCQARKSCIFTATSASEHTKQLVTSMDECHSICNQFIRFLHNTMSKEKYAQFLPAFGQLHIDYHLDIAMAYQLVRPKLQWQLYNREEYLRVRLRKYRKDLSPEQESLATWDDQDWQAPLWPIMSDTALFVSEEVRASQLVPFHATFWQLSLGEIACPDDMYNQVIKRLKDVARDLDEWAKLGVALDVDWSSAYRANRSAILSKIDALTAEREEQLRIAKEADERIDKESVKWFPDCASVHLKHKLGQILHRECFYPRAIFSMSDATFVAQIGLHLHKKRVPNFSLLIFYDKFFGDALASCIFSCSEAQATNLGRCLGLMLNDIEVWRGSKTVYNEQALGSMNEKTGQYEYQGMRLFNNEYLTWEKWGNMVYKWHRKILKAITAGLHAGDYLHIKNTIHVARNLLPAYPKVKSVFSELTKVIRDFIDAETKDQALIREDLHLAVKSYEDALTLANRDSTFIIPDDQFFTRIARPGQPRVNTNRPMEIDGSELAKPIAATEVKPEPPLTVHQTIASKQNTSDADPGDSVQEIKPALSGGADQKPLDGQTSKSSTGKNITHTEATLSLRDALLRKSEKAPFTPPSDVELTKAAGSPQSGSPVLNGVDIGTLPGLKASQVDRATTPEKSIPHEPRGKDSPVETKMQRPFRSMEPPAAPRGSMQISRQTPSAAITTAGSRQPMPSDRLDYREKPREMQAPLMPRDVREREDRHQTAREIHPRNDHATSSIRSVTGSSRRTSPSRLPGSRSGSVDSKYSRASDPHRDQERRSDRRPGERDRHLDRERDRGREPEKDRDVRKEKDQDKPTERVSDRERDHGHRSDRHRQEDNGKERRRDTRERDDKPKREERRVERDRERRDRERDRPRDRDRAKDRDDKDRSRPNRKEDDREKEKDKGSERTRERDRGERVNDKEREKDDRDRTRDTGRRDRDAARSGDGDRERYQGRNRERSEKDVRSRDERDTAGDTDSRRSDRSARGSSLEIRSSIDALSRRFDAQRQHSITDSRGTIVESVPEPVRTPPQPRELIGSASDTRKTENGSRNGDAPTVEVGSNGVQGPSSSRPIEATAMQSATPTLSSRLGPRVEPDNASRKKPASPAPMNHPLPGKPVSTGSSLASALALAISPDLRKRPVEELSATEGVRGSAAPSSANKRTRIDRQGARERGERATAAGAFSRLSGGMVNNGSTASSASSRRE